MFFGTVAIQGAPATDGVEVSAWVSGFTPPLGIARVSSDGTYLIEVPQYGMESFNGKTIGFKIGSVSAVQSGIWEEGRNIQLNLSKSTGVPSTPVVVQPITGSSR